MSLLKSILDNFYEIIQVLSPNKSKIHAFSLNYKSNQIGQLSFSNTQWTFEYSAWFKNQDSIKPLTQFPKAEEKYVSETLWPFFASRIPSKKQPQVEKFIKENPEKGNNLVALLGRFAAHSVNNPFTLRML